MALQFTHVSELRQCFVVFIVKGKSRRVSFYVMQVLTEDQFQI
jgi:metal-responsive CopG/Arc/MetJ family transcriptional regulator